MAPSSSDKRVAFIHLDLGIGGAESLIVSMASTLPPTSLHLYTCHCSPTHCFAPLKPSGPLRPRLKVHGAWIPPSVLGFGQAVMSHLRLLYLSLCLVFNVYALGERYTHVVVDVLPTPLPLLALLLPSSKTVYYCHFPDRYLTRDTVNGVSVRKTTALRSLYRMPLNWLEEACTGWADVVGVNSEFTREVFEGAFKGVRRDVKVLYPCIDLNKFIPPSQDSRDWAAGDIFLLSFNRFERKKNVELALRTLAGLRGWEEYGRLSLVVAGGWDPRNAENREYLSELEELASSLGVRDKVEFKTSVTDDERADLLTGALATLYTPEREHFGIIPLEAMYAGCPVIACDSGGPLETVKDGATGFLRRPDEGEWAGAVREILEVEGRREEMGRKGWERVKARFGLEVFGREFGDLLNAEVGERAKWRSKVVVLGAAVGAVLAFSFWK